MMASPIQNCYKIEYLNCSFAFGRWGKLLLSSCTAQVFTNSTVVSQLPFQAKKQYSSAHLSEDTLCFTLTVFNYGTPRFKMENILSLMSVAQVETFERCQ